MACKVKWCVDLLTAKDSKESIMMTGVTVVYYVSYPSFYYWTAAIQNGCCDEKQFTLSAE